MDFGGPCHKGKQHTQNKGYESKCKSAKDGYPKNSQHLLTSPHTHPNMQDLIDTNAISLVK